MIKITKYFFFIILVTILLFPKHEVKALGLPFGGYVEYAGYGECDCPVTIMNTPLYFQPPYAYPPQIVSLPLVYVPYLSMPVYSNYVIPVAGVFLLGDYYPGIQMCWYYIPPYECAPIPTSGVIGQVGTSLTTSPGQ